MISLLRSKSDFFNKRAIYVSADKLSVFHWEKGELGTSYLFDLDDTGRENFKRYIEETPNTPIYVLVDIIEEEFRQDTIPHVFGSDRKALIERKQSRLFRDAAYFYTQNQGREEGGRKDDRVLFMALSNETILQPWIQLLGEYKVPLLGILSVPLLLQSYIRSLPDISDHALFVTMQSISGLRQTFFSKKDLKISRLSKLPRYGTERYAPKINAEVDKIQRYLNSLRLIPGDSALDVYILADKTLLDEMEGEKVSSPMMRRHYLDLAKLADIKNKNAIQNVPFCDQLLISYLFKTLPKNCYASTHEMRYSKMRNIRYAMNVSSGLLLLFGMIYSSFNLMNGLTYKQESESSKNKAVFYQSRYDLAKERLPKTPVEPAQIKVAVDAVNVLNEYKSTPYEMFSFLGKGLEKFPNIKLDNLDWSYSADPNSGVTNTTANVAATTVTDTSSFKFFQTSNIEAHIEPFDGNYRDAIEVVNKFAENLRGYDIVRNLSITSFPLDISSDATLQGDSISVGKEARFSMQIVIGVEDGKR